MKNSNTKHHVVPQSYLKRFGRLNTNNKGSNIGVWSKKSSKCFIKAVKDVAYVKEYYSVNSKSDNKNYWEHRFSKELEQLYGTEIKTIISKINSKCTLNNLDKKILSKLIAFQFVRVPAFLDRQLEKGRNITEEILKQYHFLFENLNKYERQKIFSLAETDNIKNQALEIIIDDMLPKSEEILSGKTWNIYINNLDIPLFTSDNPVVLYNFSTNSFDYNNNGLGRDDNIILFPLTPKILVHISPSSFSKIINESTTDTKDIKYISTINRLQIEHCTNEVYFPPEFIDSFNPNN